VNCVHGVCVLGDIFIISSYKHMDCSQTEVVDSHLQNLVVLGARGGSRFYRV